MATEGPNRQLIDATQVLQVAIQRLQASIAQHSDKVNKVKLSTLADPNRLLSYAHKIAYTSFAPLGYKPGQALPPNARPPNPQDWQFRSSQLHQFQVEWDAKQQKPPVQAAAPEVVAAPQVPAGLSLPPMPAGWRPGMPIPGLEELLMASAAAEAVDPDLPLEAQPVNVLPSVLAGSLQDKPSSSPTPLVVGVATQQAAAQAVQQRAAETTARQAAGTLPEPALRPAPFIPDFVLNPGLEAVEENYSSSDYSEEESTA